MTDGAHDASGTECGTWTVQSSFPGRPDQVAHARRLIADSLAGCPARDDSVLMASELITNAVTHSASGQDGTFTLAGSHQTASVRVEVRDEGGKWHEPDGRDVEAGRGLLIIAQLSSAWGITGDDHGRTVWFEVKCP